MNTIVPTAFSSLFQYWLFQVESKLLIVAKILRAFSVQKIFTVLLNLYLAEVNQCFGVHNLEE